MAGKLSLAEQEKLGVDSYYDRATTKTKANTTLFVAFRDATVNVPADERASICERLFSECAGYIGIRQVRGMCFVDFEDIKSSTNAMMKNQGHIGITIDYDKDKGVAQKRQRQNDESNQRSLSQASSASYYCARCGTKALQTKSQLLSDMPTRSTDGAVVVDEGSALLQLMLEPSTEHWPAKIAREKGTERQYRLACRSCAAVLAYRSVPEARDGKFLYVDASAIKDRPPTQQEMCKSSSSSSGSSSTAAAPPAAASSGAV